jgi:XisH protein
MAKDKYHYIVKEALEKEGWIITNDQFYIRPEQGVNFPIDLRFIWIR